MKTKVSEVQRRGALHPEEKMNEAVEEKERKWVIWVSAGVKCPTEMEKVTTPSCTAARLRCSINN